jgi:hypothetical protein
MMFLEWQTKLSVTDVSLYGNAQNYRLTSKAIKQGNSDVNFTPNRIAVRLGSVYPYLKSLRFTGEFCDCGFT